MVLPEGIAYSKPSSDPFHPAPAPRHVTSQLRLGCPPSDVSLVDVPGLPNGLGVALAANFTVPRRRSGTWVIGLGIYLGKMWMKDMWI